MAKELAKWLEALDLGQHTKSFLANAVGLQDLPHLSEDDLKGLGLPLGHRRRLQAAIKRLPGEQTDGGSASSQVREDLPLAAEAERRQLTVLFCDLVGFSALSTKLDPEDLRSIIGAYQEACAGVVSFYQGFVARYLGDGVLVYFGYPSAHEDDAQRAVDAGLAIVDRIAELNASTDKITPLAVRVGIATGPVVVGDLIGEGASQEVAVTGETPNLAAGLQQLAQPNTVIVAESTLKLIGGSFNCFDLGSHQIKGFPKSIRVTRVDSRRTTESRFESMQPSGPIEMVGRENELEILLELWRQAGTGEGQVVLLRGEAGIGKSRITQELQESLKSEPHVRVRYQCSPYYSNSAFHPVIDQLERGAGFERNDTPADKLKKLEALLALGTDNVASVMPFYARLLSIETGEHNVVPGLSPQRVKEKTIEALVAQAVGLSAKQPLLIIMEDLHWIDPTSLEVLDALVNRITNLRALMLLTYRPELEPPWVGMPQVTQLILSGLSSKRARELIGNVTGSRVLPEVILEQIVAKTDGVPLFIEELTRTVIGSDLLAEKEKSYVLTGPLPPLAIPTTLRDSLTARLDRLAPIKETAQIAAVIGRKFSFDQLSLLSPLREAELRDALHELQQSNLIDRRGSRRESNYAFKHALIRDAAYETLLHSRRQQLHVRFARALEEGFANIVQLQPEILAHHFASGGLAQKAAYYWLLAGQRNVSRSALREAETHLRSGLGALQTLPEGQERDQLEFGLRSMLATTFVMTRGYASPDAEAEFNRASKLGQSAVLTTDYCRTLLGSWMFFMGKGDTNAALKRMNELTALVRGQNDEKLQFPAHVSRMCTKTYRAEFDEAISAGKQILDIYQDEAHSGMADMWFHDPKMLAHMYLAHAWWITGFPDQALGASVKALAHARNLKRPFGVALALQWAGLIHLYRGDLVARAQWADECISLAQEFGFPFEAAYSLVWRGWVDAMSGALSSGLGTMRTGLESGLATGSGVAVPFVRCLIAQVLVRLQRPDEARSEIDQALDQVRRWGERLHEPEILRVLGTIEEASGNEAVAERCLADALGAARKYRAKSFELRSAMSLARLWCAQGRLVEARELLSPVYEWFTEGFDTADLKEARALLNELS